MSDDTDLTGLDLEGAKAYILEFAVEAKRLEKELAALKADLDLWKGRVALAEGKAMPDLASAARNKVAEIEGRMAALGAECADILSKVEAMRLRLPAIRAAERSVDPDRLLAELQLMTGELLGDDVTSAGATSESAPAAAAAGAGGASTPGDSATAGAQGAPGAAATSPAGRSDVAVNRDFSRLEAESASDAALAELKRKMGETGGKGSGQS